MSNDDEPQGLPAPPPLGASALPAGTFDGTAVLITGAGTGSGQGDRPGIRPPRGEHRDRQS